MAGEIKEQLTLRVGRADKIALEKIAADANVSVNYAASAFIARAIAAGWTVAEPVVLAPERPGPDLPPSSSGPGRDPHNQ